MYMGNCIISMAAHHRDIQIHISIGLAITDYFLELVSEELMFDLEILGTSLIGCSLLVETISKI